MSDNGNLAITYKYLGQTEDAKALDKVLEDLISRSTNLEVLNRVRDIISYRTKILEKNL